MLSEFFVTFVLPRRVRRDPRIARGLDRLFWRGWRALARRREPAGADTLLGFFGPLALLSQLVVWALGSMVGYGLIEWAVAGGSFSTRFLTSSGLFLSTGTSSGSAGEHVVELLEAATGVGVLFIVIGYMPAVYSAFSRRETAMSKLATRAGSPPAAAAFLQRAASRGSWRHLEQDLQAWEGWAAELMETHLTYPRGRAATPAGRHGGLEVSVIDRWQKVWPGARESHLAAWLSARQLFVALIVTAATLLANRSVVVFPGTSIQIRNGFFLGVFDLLWTTLTVLWFAQIFWKHLGATNPDRYLALLSRALFPIVEVVRKIGISQPGEWTADFVESRLVWPASIEQLRQGAPDRPLTHGDIWRAARSTRRELRHPGGPKPT